MRREDLRPGDPTSIGNLEVVARLSTDDRRVVYLARSPDGVEAAVEVLASGRAVRPRGDPLATPPKHDQLFAVGVVAAFVMLVIAGISLWWLWPSNSDSKGSSPPPSSDGVDPGSGSGSGSLPRPRPGPLAGTTASLAEPLGGDLTLAGFYSTAPGQAGIDFRLWDPGDRAFADWNSKLPGSSVKYPTVSPDGRWYAHTFGINTPGRPDILVTDRIGRTHRTIYLPNSLHAFAAKWSPGGGRLLITVSAADPTSTDHQITRVGWAIADVSPSGESKVTLSDSSVVRVSDAARSQGAFHWDTDGSTVIGNLQNDVDAELPDIAYFSPEGAPIRTFEEAGELNGAVTSPLSPSGSRLLVLCGRSESSVEICTVDTSSGERLTSARTEFRPQWRAHVLAPLYDWYDEEHFVAWDPEGAANSVTVHDLEGREMSTLLRVPRDALVIPVFARAPA